MLYSFKIGNISLLALLAKIKYKIGNIGLIEEKQELVRISKPPT